MVTPAVPDCRFPTCNQAGALLRSRVGGDGRSGRKRGPSRRGLAGRGRDTGCETDCDTGCDTGSHPKGPHWCTKAAQLAHGCQQRHHGTAKIGTYSNIVGQGGRSAGACGLLDTWWLAARSSLVGAVSKAIFKLVFVVGVIALAIAGVLRIFFVDLIVVGNNGMAPTIIAGEEVLMWRGTDSLDLSDIVVCRHPTDNRVVMGRLIARNGTKVNVERGTLQVAGQSPGVDIQEPRQFYDVDIGRASTYTYALEQIGNTEHPIFVKERYNFRLRETVVGEGKIFLLSDNRSAEIHDSRSYGELDPSNCLGTIFMRWKSVDDGGADLGHGWLDFIK